ncbi:RNA 2',3'-cyclic phosphodiesterase [Burkholderia anthina]|uniref:RNA 2',3'-cyclic phosphodiesterase n=1 Tax=Burkholderia anthina TaxID=179879 RepID=UPI00158CD489|nr:RNA 2',3'-cyclic phosphodiesterase [Burkholderia anthina]
MTQLTLPGIEAGRLEHHLFFAVKPDPDTAARIADQAGRLQAELPVEGRLQNTDRFHITLQSLGPFMQVPSGVAARACMAAQRIRVAPFDVTFDRILSFKGRPGNFPWVLTPDIAPGALAAFHQKLVDALNWAGFRASGKHFTPHVTLLYSENRFRPREIAPITWSVREFVLVDSWLGKTHHEIKGCWPLSDDGLH